jgi:putative FmdB family regulatory protein
MPLYEYECDSCHHRFEVIQRFTDPPPQACPECAGPVTKLPSSPAIQFKGTGWYITDYARKGGSNESDGKASDASKPTESAKPAETTSSSSTGSSSTSAPDKKTPQA